MNNIVITINGVGMTQKEYNAYRKAKVSNSSKRKSVRKTKAYSEVDYIKEYIDSVVNKLSVLNSIVAYRRHSYKQWGNVAKLILSLKGIDVPFNKSCVEINRLKDIVSSIEKTRSKYLISDLLYKFQWQLEDVNTTLVKLVSGIQKSEIQWSPMGCDECVVGKGKRLGLMTICYKAENAIKDIQQMNGELHLLLENM